MKGGLANDLRALFERLAARVRTEKRPAPGALCSDWRRPGAAVGVNNGFPGGVRFRVVVVMAPACRGCRWSFPGDIDLMCVLPGVVPVAPDSRNIPTLEARQQYRFCGPAGVFFEREPGADEA